MIRMIALMSPALAERARAKAIVQRFDQGPRKLPVDFRLPNLSDDYDRRLATLTADSRLRLLTRD